MDTLTVDLGSRAYKIYIGSGLLDNPKGLPFDLCLSAKNMLISNPTVFNLYGERVLSFLRHLDIHCDTILIPDGELYKDLTWIEHILTAMLRCGLDRKSMLFALGGGVIGDITGFAASIYMRGIPFVQIPTTLLAQVDSSVGGKTGVNHSLGKNMIGTFHQPCAVIIDTDTLLSLPEREYRCGIAEVIKYGIISDARFFNYLENKRQDISERKPACLREIIRTSCSIKAQVVALDEKEVGLRAILNYGHTIGHAIETETDYSVYKHGEAVAIGMALEAQLARRIGVLPEDEAVRISALIEAYGLPASLPGGMDVERLLNHMRLDKKTESGKITVITPLSVGEVKITKAVALEDIRAVLKNNK